MNFETFLNFKINFELFETVDNFRIQTFESINGFSDFEFENFILETFITIFDFESFDFEQFLTSLTFELSSSNS